MDIRKRLSITLAALLALSAVQIGLMPNTAQAGQMTKKQVAERWKKLKGKNWSRKDMQTALNLSNGESVLFDTIVSLKRKHKLSWGAIVQTMKICEKKPGAMKEFWEYVKKYKFHPREVTEVFKTFPPSKTHRWFYFYFRAGGGKGFQQRAQAGKDKKKKSKKKGKKRKKRKKPEKKVEGYSKDEVMGVFKRARFDIKLLKKYFEKRQAGIPIKKAWGEIREEVQAQKEEERKKEIAKRKEKEQREKERREKMKKLKKFKEEQKKAKQDSDEKKEKVQTTTLGNLLGGGSDSEDKSEEKDKDSNNKKDEKESGKKDQEDKGK